MTLTTVGEGGVPASRTLIVKDIDGRGLHFSSSRSSRKGIHLAQRPVATMLFFGRPLGRQVEVTGDVVALDAAASQADWRECPSYDGTDNPDWQVWAVQPTRYEFLQATHDRKHTRVEFKRGAEDWTRSHADPTLGWR